MSHEPPSRPVPALPVVVQEDQVHRRAARAGLSADLEDIKSIKRLAACCTGDLIQPLLNANHQIPEADVLATALFGHVQQNYPDMPATAELCSAAVERVRKAWGVAQSKSRRFA